MGLRLAPDPLIGPLIRERPGLRLPGAWDGFECRGGGGAGQQGSVAAGCTLARRLVERAGMAVARGTDGLTLLFPGPANLAGANLEGLGIPGARQATLRALARAWLERGIDFGAAPEELAAAMAALPGIGPWTAQYVALRALGEPDALPTGHPVLRRMAAPPGCGSLTARELDERSREWGPWRGYAVVHLWGAAARLRQVPSGRARVRRAA